MGSADFCRAAIAAFLGYWSLGCGSRALRPPNSEVFDVVSPPLVVASSVAQPDVTGTTQGPAGISAVVPRPINAEVSFFSEAQFNIDRSTTPTPLPFSRTPQLPAASRGSKDVLTLPIIQRIDRPNVRQRMTEYPMIRFKPGDTITVRAGGCVQTGGAGHTWKRYVDPIGWESDRYYHGLIWIPGAEGPSGGGLVRLAAVIDRPFKITSTLPPGLASSQLFLRLGYEDDNYADNGYWGHDDGTDQQCSGMGPAWVEIRIDRSAPANAPSKPFDLLWCEVDDNVIPRNPLWGYQLSSGGSLRSPADVCGGRPDQPNCTSQQPSWDRAVPLNSVFSCPEDGGHLNWFSATYDGIIYWDEHSWPDDDYNFKLAVGGNRGLVSANEGLMQLEFAAYETIDRFNTGWWKKFREAVDGGGAAASGMVYGKRAIVSGLIGLDCVHDCQTELHPVWALAINVDDNPKDELWPIFVRNWGNEGWCSHDQHYIDLLGGKYTFRLPWHFGARSVTVKRAQFTAGSQYCIGPDITVVPGEAVLVTFQLPKPEQHAMISGELHLEWDVAIETLPAPPDLHVSPAAIPTKRPESDEDEPERKLNAIWRDMPAQQRRLLVSKLSPSPYVQDSITLAAREASIRPDVAKMIARVAEDSRSYKLMSVVEIPRVYAVPAPQKVGRDRILLDALKDILGRRISKQG